MTCCLSRYFHCKYLWKYIDILNSLNGASERNSLTSAWHSEKSSLVLDVMSFLTVSITLSGRMVIQAGLEVVGEESGSASSVLDSSPSSVFPFIKPVSLSTVSGEGGWRPGQQFPFNQSLYQQLKCAENRFDQCRLIDLVLLKILIDFFEI